MVNVIIENIGKFQVPTERVSELLAWLHNVQAVAIKNESSEYKGQQLING